MLTNWTVGGCEFDYQQGQGIVCDIGSLPRGETVASVDQIAWNFVAEGGNFQKLVSSRSPDPLWGPLIFFGNQG